MKVILQTTPLFFTEEDKIITALFEEGLDVLHVHKKQAQPILYERLLSLIPEQYHQQIVMQEHFYLAEEYNLQGIHLTRRNPNPPENYSGRLSHCAYSLEDLQKKKNKDLQYISLKYVFDSISGLESSHYSIQDLQDAARKGIVDRKTIAQTGINKDNISIVKDLGFGGILLCGDIWQRFNPHSGQDFRDLIGEFRKIKKQQ